MDSREGWVACSVVFAAAMAAYLLTICPTIYVGDSGDFISASYTLGVAHPTGYPLYMLVGKVFSFIHVGSIAYRYNLLGAVFGALAAVLACWSSKLLTKSWLAGVGVGLMVAYCAALWDQTTVAEVYSLNGLFTTLVMFLILQWREDRGSRGLLWVALAFGFGLTNHVSMVMYVPAFAYLIAAGNRRLLAKQDVKASVAAFLAPLLLYLYLPIAASGNTRHNWHNPNNLQRFMSHVTGTVHRANVVLSLTKEQFFERFFGILYHYLRQFSGADLLVLAGLYRHGGKNRVFLNFTGLMVLGDVIYALFLNDVSLEITTFCIPSIIVLGVWAGFTFQDIFKWLRKETQDVKWQYAAVAAVGLIVFAANYWVNDKSQNVIAYDFGMNLLKTVDQNAVIFAEGDNMILPATYLLTVENVRPDVSLYDRSGILSHGLYGVDYFWLQPEEHQRRQYEVEYNMIKSGRPVYYTTLPDMGFPGYRYKQTGLLYRVVAQNETLPPVDYWKRYDIREVWNSTIFRDYMTRGVVGTYYVRLASDYEETDKDKSLTILRKAAEILPDNMYIPYELGQILLAKKDYKGAAEEFRKAIGLEPKSEKSHNNLGYALMKQGQKDAAVKEYMTSLKIDPYYGKARYNLAVFLVNEGRYPEAAEQYRLMLTYNPDYVKGYFDLGLIYYNMSKRSEAAVVWEKYLQLQPNDPAAPQIRAKIQEIQAAAKNQ